MTEKVGSLCYVCFVFNFFLTFLLVAHTKVKSVREESWLVSMSEI